MSKTSKLAILFFVTSIGIILYSLFGVNSSKEKVLIEEEILFGDKEEVEDLVLNVTYTFNQNHFWDLTIPTSDVSESEVAYTFHYEQVVENENDYDVSVFNDVYGSKTYISDAYFSDDGESEQENSMSLLYKDLIEKTTSYPTTYELAYEEYFDYYPVTFYHYSYKEDGTVLSNDVLNEITELVKYPIIENDTFKVTLDNENEMVSFDFMENENLTYTNVVAKVNDDGMYLISQLMNEEISLSEATLYYISFDKEETSKVASKCSIQKLTTFESVAVNRIQETKENIFVEYIKEDDSHIAILNKDGEVVSTLINENNRNINLSVCEEGIIVYDELMDTFEVYNKENEMFNFAYEGTFEFDEPNYFNLFITLKNGKVTTLQDTNECHLLFASYDKTGLVFASKYKNSHMNTSKKVDNFWVEWAYSHYLYYIDLSIY